MAGLSDKAFAVMAVCEETKKTFGITVDYVSLRKYSFEWAFKIDKEKARKEGFDEHSVRGAIVLSPNYPGCPYCGSKQFYICKCGRIVCYHGQKIATCPECGFTGELTTVEEINLKGGGH